MDAKEKAAIEADARRDVAERGPHGRGLNRYLHASEQHAIKENREDVLPAAAERRPDGEPQP